MKDTILRNWNLMRWLRLFLGLAAMIQGILMKEYFLALAGSFVSGMAIFNTGCCGVNGCAVPVKNKNENSKEIEYEEVVK